MDEPARAIVNGDVMSHRRHLILSLTAWLVAFSSSMSPAWAEDRTLRIAMTASDIPTTTGMPNNGFEGMRFLGFPIFEGLIAFDLTTTGIVKLKPGLAERWDQAPDDRKTWIFHLRKGVKFHDGTDFNADAVIWNIERFWKSDSPQFEAAGAGITRARNPLLASWKKIDDDTVALTTTQVASYFQWMVPYLLFASPTSFEKNGKDWGKVAAAGAAGTGPFKIKKVVQRQSVALARNEGYWDAARMAKVDQVVLLPIPEANTRLAALRSGQVDWIEVPPPDGIPSLRQAGFVISTGSYPHVWPWMYNMAAKDSPFKDVRVRQALNYCIDRKAIVGLLNDTAEPSVGWLKPSDPAFGHPENQYTFDPAKGKKLLAEAGFDDKHPLSFKVMISTSGSGQMLPLPMNEALQENLKQACNVDVKVDAVEWQVLLNVARAVPDSPSLNGAMAINVSSPSSDAGAMYRYFDASNFSPSGFNFEHWTDDKFQDAMAKLADATDEATYTKYYAAAHERLVDNPPWLFIVHDLNPRAFSKNVQGFVSPQSWFVDLTLVSLH
jgi:peptide/nickel transport system substrate-binding protein